MATPEEILRIGFEQAAQPINTLMAGRLNLARENAARNIMLADQADRRQQSLEDEERRRKQQLEDEERRIKREDSIYSRNRTDKAADRDEERKWEDTQRAKIFKEQMANTDTLEDKQVRRELDALRVPYDPAAPIATLRGLLAQEKTKVRFEDAVKIRRAEQAVDLEGKGFGRKKGESDEEYLGRYGQSRTESEWRAYDSQVESANQAETDAREALKDALSIGQNRNVEAQALQEAAALSGITIQPNETAAQVADRIANDYIFRQGAAQEKAQQFLLAYNEAVTSKGALTKEELDFRRQSVSAALQSLRSASMLKQELAKRRPVIPRPANLSLPGDNAATVPMGALPSASGGVGVFQIGNDGATEFVPRSAPVVGSGVNPAMLPPPPEQSTPPAASSGFRPALQPPVTSFRPDSLSLPDQSLQPPVQIERMRNLNGLLNSIALPQRQPAAPVAIAPPVNLSSNFTIPVETEVGIGLRKLAIQQGVPESTMRAQMAAMGLFSLPPEKQFEQLQNLGVYDITVGDPRAAGRNIMVPTEY